MTAGATIAMGAAEVDSTVVVAAAWCSNEVYVLYWFMWCCPGWPIVECWLCAALLLVVAANSAPAVANSSVLTPEDIRMSYYSA